MIFLGMEWNGDVEYGMIFLGMEWSGDVEYGMKTK